MPNQYQRVLDTLDKEAMDKEAVAFTSALIAAFALWSAYDATKSAKKAYKSFKKGDAKQGWKDVGWTAFDTLGAISGTGWLAQSVGKGAKLLSVASKLNKASVAAKAAGNTALAAKYAARAKQIMAGTDKMFKATKAAAAAEKVIVLRGFAKATPAALLAQAAKATKAAKAAKAAGNLAAAARYTKTAKDFTNVAKTPAKIAPYFLGQAANLAKGTEGLTLASEAARAAKGTVLAPMANLSLATKAGAQTIGASGVGQVVGRAGKAIGRGARAVNMAPSTALYKMSPATAGAVGRGAQAITTGGKSVKLLGIASKLNKASAAAKAAGNTALAAKYAAQAKQITDVTSGLSKITSLPGRAAQKWMHYEYSFPGIIASIGLESVMSKHMPRQGTPVSNAAGLKEIDPNLAKVKTMSDQLIKAKMAAAASKSLFSSGVKFPPNIPVGPMG